MRKLKGLRRNSIRRTEYHRLHNFLYLIPALYIGLSVILFLIFPYWQSLCAATSTLISWTDALISEVVTAWVVCNTLSMFDLFSHHYSQLKGYIYTSSATVSWKRPIQPPVQILVAGAFKTQKLDINDKTTVQHVKLELRRRHLISNPTDRRTYMVIAPTQIRPLQDHEVLYAIGIRELMTLQIRTKVLGGAPPADTARLFNPSSTHFTPRAQFPSKHPEHYRPHPTENGKFQCLPCLDACAANNSHLSRNIHRHENSHRHRAAVKEWSQSQSKPTEGESSTTTRTNVHNILASILASAKPPTNPQTHFTGAPKSPSDSPSIPDIDMDAFNTAWQEEGSTEPEQRLPPAFISTLEEYLKFANEVDRESDDDDDDAERSDIEEPESYLDVQYANLFTPRREKVSTNPESTYFPWPDRETCVLDILRHIPRCAFSRKQNIAIHWAMVALGVPNLPSDRTMDDIDKELQQICGIQTHRYDGKLGHVYYVNDLAGIIAQEMSNPSVRSHLNFLPEDTDKNLAEAYQAKRWLNELDPDLLTPVHFAAGQKFFTMEPALLTDGKTVCMPSRWFKRDGKVLAKAWPMKAVDCEGGERGWTVQTHHQIEITESELLLCFSQLKDSYDQFNIVDPCKIIDEEVSPDEYEDWSMTDPSIGNRWRQKSHGKHVVAFPIWLYCDDTSGNVSKKWNKHNSFLFTAAGLPRHLATQETNVHFLCTSNTAPPLEMLDGIVEQLAKSQFEGIWAWDSCLNDLVLVIPSVLAMLGDNPMQSEFACHIGFRGRLFCRVCGVSGKVEDDDAVPDEIDGHDSDASVGSASSQKGKGRRKAAQESMKDMITRISDFMKRGVARNRDATCRELHSQFLEASRVGGGAEFKRRKTQSGVKDTYQAVFIDKLQAIATKKGLSKDQKEREIMKLKLTFPTHTTSPIWRIRSLDPHQDTPVEVLHVILLGVVKYFWRDAVSRTKNKTDQPILIARLSSFNTWGLGLSPLDGKTLVNYAGSLTGRDFRAIAQAAPFVLQGLLTNDQLEVWKALSALVTLVWQPQIHDINEYIVELEATIDYFLDTTCRLTPRWFNKPKFHVLLHLPDHIRRFGPAMLFATESFESFNAIIRSRSVHSNRHAPSKDIAYAMAHSNRVRHLLNGGVFWTQPNPLESTLAHTPVATKTRPSTTIYEQLSQNPLQFTDSKSWKSASKDALALCTILNFDVKLLGRGHESDEENAGLLTYGGPPAGSIGGIPTVPAPLSQTIFAKKNPFQNELDHSHMYRTYNSVFLQSGDEAVIRNWIVWNRSTGSSTAIPTVGLIVEIGQVLGSDAANQEMASFVTVRRAITGEWHSSYGMRGIELTSEYQLVHPQDIQCVVNVQHNCVDNKCPVKRTAVVMKEREESKEKELQVEHVNSNSLILNTAQMRSAAYLKAFRKPITPMNREQIIGESVKKEIDLRKQKAKVDLTASKASAPPKKTAPVATSQNRMALSIHSHTNSNSPILAQPSTSLSHAPMFSGLRFTEQDSHHAGSGSYPILRHSSESQRYPTVGTYNPQPPYAMYAQANSHPFYNTHDTTHSPGPQSASQVHYNTAHNPAYRQNDQIFYRDSMYPY